MIPNPGLLEFLRAEGVVVVTQPNRDEAQVEIEGCDGTDRNACAWASLRGMDLRAFRACLDDRGLPCDCSIVMALVDLDRFEEPQP